MTDPYLQRVSFEDIQEFKDLNLFDLTIAETNGRMVLLAYDPESQTFRYAYMEEGVSTNSQNITIFYGYEELISGLIDDEESGNRPSINGFKNGDGIIARNTSGTVKKLDLYEVSINEQTDVDTYIFKASVSGGSTVAVSATAPSPVVDKGVWFQPTTKKLYVGTGGVWENVSAVDGAQGAPGAPGTNGNDGKDGKDGAPGIDGTPGLTYKRSTVFTRTSTLFEDAAVLVTGGSFSNPFPSATTIDEVASAIQWFDGVPAGSEKVWQTTFTFNDGEVDSDNPANVWTVPTGITDTNTTDYQYSTVEAAPGTPATISGNWSEEITNPTAVIWIAQRSIRNGIFGEWVVWRIKGETGSQGNGLDIKGRDTACNILNKTGVANYDIWIASGYADISSMTTCSGFTMDTIANANDAFLKVPDGTGEGGSNWDNIGGVVGANGASFIYSIVYKRSVENPGAPIGLGSFAQPVPTGWSDGIPALSVPVPEGQKLWMTSKRFSDSPSINATLAEWITPSVAADTNDIEFSYAFKQEEDAQPAAPNVTPSLWSDVPGETGYYWMAKATKTNGVIDNTTWKINRIRGERGLTGNDGESPIGKFQSSVYIRTEADISAVPVTGGTYLNPIPTSKADGKSWSDGIPGTAGAIWFTSVQMTQDDEDGTKVWPSPIKIIDTTSIEYRFSTTGKGLPVKGNDGINGWWDDADSVVGEVNFMAIGSITNNIWPTTWDIIRIKGETGPAGTAAYTYVPSTMFCRSDLSAMASASVVGKHLVQENGTYVLAGADPAVTVAGLPYTFTDGIPTLTDTFPNNSKRVWMIQGVLNSNDNLGPGNEYTWGNPVILADNGSVDYQYHAGSSASAPGVKPSPPTGSNSNPDSSGWYDSPDLIPTGAFWLAQKNWSEGPGAQWVVYQIRGEKGTAGAGAMPTTFSYSAKTLNVGEPGYTQSCSEAQALVATIGLTRYFSGFYVGDFVAIDAAGATLLNGSDDFISDGITSWRVNTVGKIVERFTCPAWTVSVPTGVTAVRSVSQVGKVEISWVASIAAAEVLAGYKVERSTTLNGATTVIGNVGAKTLSIIDEPAAAGTYYYTVVAKSINTTYNSGKSNAAVIKYTKTISMNGRYGTLEQLQSAFVSAHDANTPLQNTDFYTTSPVLQRGSMFTNTIAGLAPFDGGRYWYANYDENASSSYAYQINEYGEVTHMVLFDYMVNSIDTTLCLSGTSTFNTNKVDNSFNLTLKNGNTINWGASTAVITGVWSGGAGPVNPTPTIDIEFNHNYLSYTHPIWAGAVGDSAITITYQIYDSLGQEYSGISTYTALKSGNNFTVYNYSTCLS